ncbi:two-component regulator propeller domain-containing protein [Piscinibacter sakaiensis]|uniref:two-component regulator propeller domain-containing protein n=1 Tax=Piscinibacter sakaiensis TaxID=1547922 RepID=UPI003AAF75D3
MLSVALTASAAEVEPAAMRPMDEPRLERIGQRMIPRDVVASLAQDKAGFIWIGTGDGLVRYDGHNFRPLLRESTNPAARNLGWVQAMLPARDGRLWIGTESLGLGVHDPVTGRVEVHRPPESVADGQAAPTILALAEDHDGFIWAGGAGWLARFEPASARFEHFSGRVAGLPDDRISSLLVDREGSLWVGTWAGLARLRRGASEFEPTRWPASQPRPGGSAVVSALLQASDGRIWFGTQQGEIGAVDPARNAVSWLDSGVDAVARRGQVASFVEAPGGRLWVGSSSGIDIHRLADGARLRRLRHDPRNPAGLAANHVRTMIVDHAGFIWIGGFGLGLQRHNPTNRSILVRGPDLHPPVRLQQADIRGLLQLDNGELLASTPEQGVLVMDAGLRVTGAFDPDNPMLSPSAPDAAAVPERITAMTQAPDGSVWFAGDSRLLQYSRTRGLLRTLRHDAGITHWLHADSGGNLWLATQDGLHRLLAGQERFERIALHGGAPLKGAVFVLAQAADQTLWVGGATGLFRIKPGERQLRTVNGSDGQGLANPTVIGLLIDRNGSLWVDTAVTGLHRLLGWDGQHAVFDRISERHGVTSRPFGASLLQDRRGRIWTHMYVYDPVVDRLHELTEADGVSIGTGWFRSYERMTNGRFLFGGSKGLLVVDPESFDVADDQPRVVVTEFRINGERQRSAYLTDGVRLGADQRRFSVEFAALDFSDSTRNRYAYRLEGYDERWIDTLSNFRVASYGNLDPGDYVLRVRTTNRSGIWSPHELVVPVRVLPAWWQHWSLRLAGVLLLGLAIWLLVQWRTRHLRRAQLRLERMVAERTIELQHVAHALKKESAALEDASLTDPLSGLRNRRFFGIHVEADTALAVRRYENHLLHGSWLAEDSDLIFFLVDIDHFKQINDSHGHAAGDAVIKQMRGRLQTVFRDSDHLIRWGGEEFLILARDAARASAAQLAERVVAAIAEPFVLDDGVRVQRTCSVGFCCFPLAPKFARAVDWNSAVNAADAALMAVKSAGRNGWLGLIQARADSAEELQQWLRRPLAQWWASGQLDVVFSSTLSGWADAPRRR